MRTPNRIRSSGATLPSIALILNASNAYGRAVFQGVMDYVIKHGPWRLLVETESDRRVDLPPTDGLLLGVCSKHTLGQLASYKGHALLLSGRAEPKGIPVVRSNDSEIGRLGARHLLDRGLRNLCFVDENVALLVRNRREGFVEEAARAGVSVTCLSIPSERSLQQRMRFQAALARLPKPVGVMAATDKTGCSVLRACAETQLRFPEELALIGVQNDELLCATCWPPLSSVQTGAHRIGFEAARLLDNWLRTGEKPPPVTEFEPLGVSLRQSTDTLYVGDPRLSKAVAFIRNHAADPCNVRDVVRHIGGGRRWLELRFQEVFHRTPHEEIQRVRIEGAKRLLENTDLTIELVAERCGLRYLPNLVRTFRNICGCTPAEYRERSK